MRRASISALVVLASTCAGCGDEREEPTRVEGNRLTVYASLPKGGMTAAAGAAVEAGMRRALADANGQAADRTVRLRVLSSTRPGDERWDPGTVEANAELAAEDRTTIAYVGELDQGGSAVSLPVTNRAGILQLSPADGLTSLTRRPPGRPSAGPERYYPEGRRTFARLVPADIEAARAIVAKLRDEGSRRLALLHGDGVADHELESMLTAMIGTGSPQTVARVAIRNSDAERARELVDEVVAARADAIVFAASAGADAAALLAELAVRLPSTLVMGGPPLAFGSGHFARAPERSCAMTSARPPDTLGPRGRALLEDMRRNGDEPVGPEAVLGYQAMDDVLAAIEEGGADRRRVIEAARRPGPRDGTLGSYSLGRTGDPLSRPVACVDLL